METALELNGLPCENKVLLYFTLNPKAQDSARFYQQKFPGMRNPDFPTRGGIQLKLLQQCFRLVFSVMLVLITLKALFFCLCVFLYAVLRLCTLLGLTFKLILGSRLKACPIVAVDFEAILLAGRLTSFYF